MRKKYLMAGAASLLLFSPLQSTFAYDGSRMSIAEEKAAIAKEEADVARDSQALEDRRALLVERKAALAKRETSPADVNQELADLHATETERGLVLTLNDVVFETDQAKLTDSAMRKLYSLVTLLKEHP